jgi:hypothetical protein
MIEIVKVSYDAQKLDWFIVGLPITLQARKGDFKIEMEMCENKA